MPDFSHLHVHTQFSLLDGAAGIPALMKKAKADNMKAIALTDHGNLFGAFKFVAEANKQGIKPIVGCEFYVVEDRHQKTFTKENKDKRYHQLLLAKDQEGYKNLSKLCSLGFVEGMYSKWPRIDKELLLQYHEGLIATSCCIGASVPQAILNKSEEEAEQEFKWWLDVFGKDYYIEIQRHGLENINGTGKSQEDINQLLLKWSKKYDVKTIATNDSHYIEQEDANAHDILLCINTGDLKSIPVGDGKGFRFGFPNDQFYFKTQAEMNRLFADVPEAIDNTNEIVDKITSPQLKRDILLPNFVMPPEFKTQDDYLTFLAFEGAKKRYKILTPEIEERIVFELKVIKDMGFPGYFLIVQDFIAEGRNLGVAIGPGRGSAAGSVVAYCIGITNIDPIKYSLLFERFLNPERVSMPDIDIDFDDEGRQKVIDYVINKYGKNQVAQIITYGTMAAKMAIKDVARVLDLPLSEADKLTKLVPDISLDKLFNTDLNKLAKEINPDAIEKVKQLRKIIEGNDLVADTLKQAKALEGSVRNTGIHAAGVIIAPTDLMDCIPVFTAKDADLWVTQFDGKHIEDAGMLKMDFLGLKTLTIIKHAIKNIKKNYDIEIDPDEIPLDDPKTFELYQRGDTIGTFQFESPGMQKHLRDLKPTTMEDLIAMNALYRPGPMQFIENFIKRKHGREQVEYPHELLKPILENTNGIMVYQEQIMQAAQILAGYSLGGADLLRRAMGKKDMKVMEQQKEVFIEGAKKLHDINEKKSAEVFDVMMKFAEYGFNRSHSAAYSLVAFQTAYLKANYPAEYMAAVLTNNMNDIKKVAFFMEECKRAGIKVTIPDVNESEYLFTVNKRKEIRFGLGAVKGIGEGAVDAIVNERNQNGNYKDIFDLVRRIDLRAANKRCLENLALAGAYDSFENIHRAQYFFQEPGGNANFIEKVIRYGNSHQEDKNAPPNLFGESSAMDIKEPDIPVADEWSTLEKLAREKEVVGIYISGHPLDDFKLEIDNFCTHGLAALQDLSSLKNREIAVSGIVTEVVHRMTKTGKPFGLITIEDYSDSFQLALFSDDYINFRKYMEKNYFLFVKGRVQDRKWTQDEQLEIKISSIQMLTEVKNTMIKSLTLNIDLDDLTDDFIEKLEHLLQSAKGNCRLKLSVFDNSEKLKVEMPAKKIKLELTNDFIDKINRIPQITYSVN